MAERENMSYSNKQGRGVMLHNPNCTIQYMLVISFIWVVQTYKHTDGTWDLPMCYTHAHTHRHTHTNTHGMLSLSSHARTHTHTLFRAYCVPQHTQC